MRNPTSVLLTAGIAAVSALILLPQVSAQSAASTVKFDVAAVKPFKDDGGPRNAASYGPQGITFRGLTLAFIVGEAFSFPVGRIVGPGSLTPESLWPSLMQGYDIVAHADHPVPREELKLMLQSLLAERFNLRLHREAKTSPVYKLVITKGGPKLEASPVEGDLFMAGGPDGYVFRNAEIMRLAGALSGRLDRSVVDQTGLMGRYNFVLQQPAEVRQDAPG